MKEDYYSVSYLSHDHTWILDCNPKLLESARKRIKWLFKNNTTIIQAKIESHQVVKRGKLTSSQVTYRESYNRYKPSETHTEISPHMIDGICPIHKTLYRDQVGKGGFEIINGICDQCLSNNKEKRP